jgi:hypothetical protein
LLSDTSDAIGVIVRRNGISRSDQSLRTACLELGARSDDVTSRDFLAVQELGDHRLNCRQWQEFMIAVLDNDMNAVRETRTNLLNLVQRSIRIQRARDE